MWTEYILYRFLHLGYNGCPDSVWKLKCSKNATTACKNVTETLVDLFYVRCKRVNLIVFSCYGIMVKNYYINMEQLNWNKSKRKRAGQEYDEKEGFRRKETERIQREAGGEYTWSMVLVQWSELTEELATEGEIFGLPAAWRDTGRLLWGKCTAHRADSAHGN